MSRILKALRQIDSRTLETIDISGDDNACAEELRVDKTMVIAAAPTNDIGDTLEAVSEGVDSAIKDDDPQSDDAETVAVPTEMEDPFSVEDVVEQAVAQKEVEVAGNEAESTTAFVESTAASTCSELQEAPLDPSHLDEEGSVVEGQKIVGVTDEPIARAEPSNRQKSVALPPPKSPVEMIEELSKLLNVKRPARPASAHVAANAEAKAKPSKVRDRQEQIQAAESTKPTVLHENVQEIVAGNSDKISCRPKTRRDAERTPRTAFEQIVADNLKSSVLAEQYHRVATAIATSTSPEVPSSLSFVALDHGGAAAHYIAHLGVVLAKQGLGEVVIVDCDIYTRSLTRQFKQQISSGVAETLEKQTNWRRSIVPTSFDQLDFLPAGHLEINNVSRVAPGLAHLIHDLKSDYKFALVDVGSPQKTMSQVLGRYCDMTYLLIELGSTDIRQARKTADKLRSTGSRIVGVVVLEPTGRFVA